MTLQFTVLELSCLLHIRLQEELVRFAMKKTSSILHVLFSNSSLFENEVFGEGDFIKNVCVRITLLVFPLFKTFFPYKFLFKEGSLNANHKAKSLNTSQRGVVRNLSYLPPTLGCLFPAVLSPLSMEYFLSSG